jgi:hypothetical protein
MIIADTFDPLVGLMCDGNEWPFSSERNPRLVKDACKRYGAMVGQVLVEG